MYEPNKDGTAWKKTIRKEHILYHSIKKKINIRDKEIMGCPVLRGETGCGCQKTQSSFQGDV